MLMTFLRGEPAGNSTSMSAAWGEWMNRSCLNRPAAWMPLIWAWHGARGLALWAPAFAVLLEVLFGDVVTNGVFQIVGHNLSPLSIVFEGGRVADLLAPLLGVEDAAHDLAAPRFGERRDEF